jgi:hypothetical protein
MGQKPAKVGHDPALTTSAERNRAYRLDLRPRAKVLLVFR